MSLLFLLIYIEAWEKLLSVQTKPLTVNADALDYFQELIETCWGLFNKGEMEVAEQILSTLLPKMSQHVPHNPQAAIIIAQGLRLQGLMSAHQLKLFDKVAFCQKAVEYARQANECNTLVATLNGLAVAFKYAQQPENSFKTYQEALSYCDQASQLIKSRVYAGSAAAFAQRGRTKEAHFYIGLAYESFPDHPENDPHVLSADNGIFMLAYYEGVMYLALNQPKEAEKAFERYKTYPSGKTIPERNRLEIVNYQGQAAIMLNNLDVYVNYLEEGIVGSVTLRSKKRFDEALTIFKRDMPASWRNDSQIKTIVEQYHLQGAL